MSRGGSSLSVAEQVVYYLTARLIEFLVSTGPKRHRAGSCASTVLGRRRYPFQTTGLPVRDRTDMLNKITSPNHTVQPL